MVSMWSCVNCGRIACAYILRVYIVRAYLLFRAKMKKVSESYAKAQSGIKGRLDGHYQHEGVKWMLSRELTPTEGKGGILADDMGLGKTMQTIATMRGNPTPTLIITIVGTVAQWRDALISFGGYKPIIVNPSFLGILPDTEKDTVLLTTYSSFQKSIPPPCLTTAPWGRIILDEGHKIRNSKTKVFKEISNLSADIKWILSGTPIQNTTKDLVTLCQWITPIQDPKQVDLDDLINTIVLRRTQESEAQLNPRLALPGLTTNVVYLKFETDMEREFYEQVEEYYTDNKDPMEAMIRCRQAATHPQIFLDSITNLNKKNPKKQRLNIPTELPPSASKFKYITTDLMKIKATTKEKSLIFATWTIEMKLLQQHLKEHGIASLIYDGNLSRDNKEATLYNFINTTIPVLILQINCGNAGLNLQCASRVYITTPQWNPCVELQAIGRSYRKGQTNKVTCYRLIMEGTIEEKCGDIQQDKLELISDTMCDESMQTRLNGT
jgi:SNF2 family DNA or RNA helicase